MLKEKSSICVLWTERKLLTEYQGKCWNGQERNSRSFGYISDECV